MARDQGDSREQGIEFGSLADELAGETYPLSHQELLDKYGEQTLELEAGSATLREILGQEHKQEYEDEQSVRQSVFNMSGSDAVGREGYSDRAGTAGGSEENEDDQSI
ncbi:MAG: DUF5789 family protein [Halapricum sp.]